MPLLMSLNRYRFGLVVTSRLKSGWDAEAKPNGWMHFAKPPQASTYPSVGLRHRNPWLKRLS